MMKSSNYSWPRGVLYKCKGTHTKLQVQVSQVKSSAKYKTQHSITYKLSQSRYNSQVCYYVQVLAFFGELYTVCYYAYTKCKKVWLKIGQCPQIREHVCLETHFKYEFFYIGLFWAVGASENKIQTSFQQICNF